MRCLPLRVARADSDAAHGIYYRSLFNTDLPHTAFIADLELDTTLPLLLTYFNLAIPLAPLYADWSARDPHFRAKILENGNRLEGIRVLKQDSVRQFHPRCSG